MARNLPLKLMLALGGAYVATRSLAFLGVDAREFRDTIDYNEVADAPLFSSKFLAGDHPPTVPLFYKLLGDGDGPRLVGQLVFSIGSWLTLAGVVAAMIRNARLRVLAFTAVLLFSLATPVLLWDALLLSESVSISLTVLLVAGWLWLAHKPSAWALGVVLALAGLWTLARDPHAYVLLLLALALAVSLVVRRGGRLRVVALAGLLAIAAISLVSASVGYKRWEYPLQNIITNRIAADPEALDYFRDAGMPVTRRFLELSRQYRATGEDPFLHPAGFGNPELRPKYLPFQVWLIEEGGRDTYIKYLATHPGAVAEAIEDLDHSLLDPQVDWYQSDEPPADLGFLAAPFYPPGPVLPLVYLAVALLVAAVAARRRAPPATWAAPAFLVAGALFLAVFVWHGEVLELDRKGLIASISLRLAALLLLVFAIDQITTPASSRRRSDSPRAEREAARAHGVPAASSG